ncbi:phage tail assembly chaperone [Brenneria goodwinii]|uniref:phage tail assembly chaperone n=1 Tax=Brenneria goodwinii TaxID=1109412 RepID=UPI0035C7478A
MSQTLRDLALAPGAGFRTKTIPVPEWNGVKVTLREPSANAWSRARKLLADAGDADTEIDEDRVQRGLKADVVLFIDILLDESGSLVFSENDVDELALKFGPVHTRLLRQALALSNLNEEDAKKK